MTMRTLTSFSLMSVLALGLTACGDDGKPNLTTATTATTPGTTNTTNTTNNNTTDGTDTDNNGTETDGTETDGTASESTATETASSTPTTTEEPVTTTETSVTSETTVEPETTTSTTTTEGTTTEGTTDGTTGGGGGEYQACGAMGECPAGSDCLELTGIEGTFCSPMCDGMACPPTGAEAQGQCVLGMGMGDPTYCAALCPPGDADACPEGTTCKEVPDQPMPIGICTAP